MKNLKLPAKLKLSDEFILNGTLSVFDALFTFAKAKEQVFARAGNIEFEYKDNKFSFSLKNLGGRYFVANHKEDSEYQKLITLINLNETLAIKDEKPSIAKRKI